MDRNSEEKFKIMFEEYNIRSAHHLITEKRQWNGPRDVLGRHIYYGDRKKEAMNKGGEGVLC